MSSLRLLLGGALGLAVLAGAGDASAQARKVSIALSGGQNTIFAPFLVAAGSGAFERRNIDMEQQPFSSGVSSFAAFAGGSTNLCVCGATQVLTAGAAGRDVVSVFNQYLGGAVTFIGPKKYEQERGTDLKKYDGATWAYTAEGSVSQVFMIRAAQAAGLDWNKQKRLAIGGVEAFVPALRQGMADLVTMDAMSGAKAMSLGIGYPVLNTNDPATVEPIWGQQIGLPVVATRAFLQKDPKLAQDIVDALREALLLVQRHLNDPDAILKLMPKDYQEANRADFAAQWQLVKPAFAVDGTFSEKALNDTVAFARSTGALKVPENAPFDVTKFFDNTYAKQALVNVPALR